MKLNDEKISNEKLVSNFKERLKMLLEIYNYSISDLARRIGINRSTVSHYLRGDYVPKITRAKEIADKLGVSFMWLTGFDVDIKESSNEISKQVDFFNREFIKVPIVGKIKAGIPILAEEHINDYKDVDKTIIKSNKIYYVLEVSGDSMYPDFMDNDLVLVEKTSTFNNGDVCVVMINGDEATLKVVKKDKEGVDIIPINPMYQKRRYTSEEAEALPVEIAGVVVRLIDRQVKRK